MAKGGLQSLADRPDSIILSHQRSGTHFLQASLSSHPAIHGRDEFLMHFRCPASRPGREHDAKLISYDLRNRPGFHNIAIVMYSQVELYEQHIGSIFDVKVIHLLRDPRDVARSYAQMMSDKGVLGIKYRPHYSLGDSAALATPVVDAIAEHKVSRIAELQERFREKLAGHGDILTLQYEELTGRRQVNELPDDLASHILRFLGLEFHRLTNRLRKTGPADKPASRTSV
jgi:hypothetical protein